MSFHKYTVPILVFLITVLSALPSYGRTLKKEKVRRLSIQISNPNLAPNAISSISEEHIVYSMSKNNGTLPDSILNCKGIDHVDIYSYGEPIVGSLFKQLAEFDHLIFLEMDGVLPAPARLPNELGELTHLNTVHIGITNLENLGEGFYQLKTLKTIRIGYTNIKTVSSSIANFQNLEELHISNNKIQSLPAELWNLPNLRTLNAQSNQLQKIKTHRAYILPQCTDIDFSINFIDEFNPSLIQLPNLVRLNLSYNELVQLPFQDSTSNTILLENHLTMATAPYTKPLQIDVRENAVLEFPENQTSTLRHNNLSYLKALYYPCKQIYKDYISKSHKINSDASLTDSIILDTALFEHYFNKSGIQNIWHKDQLYQLTQFISRVSEGVNYGIINVYFDKFQFVKPVLLLQGPCEDQSCSAWNIGFILKSNESVDSVILTYQLESNANLEEGLPNYKFVDHLVIGRDFDFAQLKNAQSLTVFRNVHTIIIHAENQKQLDLLIDALLKYLPQLNEVHIVVDFPLKLRANLNQFEWLNVLTLSDCKNLRKVPKSFLKHAKMSTIFLHQDQKTSIPKNHSDYKSAIHFGDYRMIKYLD